MHTTASTDPTLYYIHDPMCSWCWGFKPVWVDLQARLPSTLTTVSLLGGLAPDTDTPMPDAMRRTIRDTWHRIEQEIPGSHFNFDFWTRCTPRRATYSACRAVIAARAQAPDAGERMTLAIQEAYYRSAQNPSDEAVLLSLADQLMLDQTRFKSDLRSTATDTILDREIRLSRTLGAQGFPSLVLAQAKTRSLIPLDYNHSEPMLKRINDLLTMV